VTGTGIGSMLTALSARPLGSSHHDTVERVLRADPYASCLVAARFDESGMDVAGLGGQLWGISGGRAGLCYFGSNLIPIAGDARAVRTFATVAGRHPRRSASIVGRSELVLPLWDLVRPHWGEARTVRENQPLLVCTGPPLVDPDPRVRQARASDLDAYFPAAVAMFTEEVGTDPRAGDGGRSYRRRLADLIAAGRAFVMFDGDEVVFKAEVGAVSDTAAMVQGVWVHPELRGQGIGSTGMAAVVRAVQDGLDRTPVLYVNDFNLAARRVYDRVGFHQVAAFASVLF